MTISIRAIAANEVDGFREELLRTFGVEPERDERAAERFCELLSLERTYAAFDGDAMVATAAAFTHELSVPGGTLPMAGLTMVTVRPTHRRRGILRSLMDAHLRDVAARGEPLSGLWASESAIYERFGYGVAAESDDLRFDATTMEIAVPGTPDRVELADASAILDELAAAYDRMLPLRPGMLRRGLPWWRHRHLHDPPERRGGGSSKRWAVARRAGDVTGWLAYRQHHKFDGGLAAGTVQVVELMALDATAEASLWSFVANLDLFPHVRHWNAPTDALLRWLTPQRRAIGARLVDTLWLRPCDVPAALEGRAYACDGNLTFEVRGDGTYELTVSDGAATCRATDASAALRLDRAALGSIFLGSVRPSVLAGSGRIAGDSGSLVAADRLFAWPVTAWCPEMF